MKLYQSNINFKAYCILFFVSLLIIQSCKKEIKLDTLDYEPTLSIQCLLQPGKAPKMYIYRTTEYFKQEVTPQNIFARDAVITISGNNQSDVLVADSIYNLFLCRYEPFFKGNFVISENKTYDLEILYKGKTYTAQTITNVSKVNMNSVNYVYEFKDIYGGHEGVVVNFDDPAGETNYYRYQMNRNVFDTTTTVIGPVDYFSPCMNPDDKYYLSEIARFVYFDNQENGGTIEFPVEPAYEHSEGDTGYVFLQTLDKETAEYFHSLDQQRKANVNPFAEPIYIKSNIENAIGIFGSMNISDSVLFIYPE